jgi:hypothetical protein
MKKYIPDPTGILQAFLLVLHSGSDATYLAPRLGAVAGTVDFKNQF